MKHFEQEESQLSENLKTLSSYYDAFQKFVKIYFLFENVWNKDNGFSEISDEDLKNFVKMTVQIVVILKTFLKKLIVECSLKWLSVRL